MKIEVRGPYSPKDLVLFIYLFCKMMMMIIIIDGKLKAEGEKLLWKSSGARMEFLAKLHQGALAASQPSGYLEAISLYMFQKIPSKPHYRMKTKCQSSGTLMSHFQVSTILTVGLWQRKVVMTVFSS